jgi:tRNA(His) guanylyltransferase
MFENQTLGDWCKWLEKNFSPDIAIPTLPIIIRLDGNNFHNWTKGLRRPFDERLQKLMEYTTIELVKETNALVGYTQSDEITLLLYSDNRKSQVYHVGKKQKILSKLTGVCVNTFNEKRRELLPDHDKIANFDCRMYQTPSKMDAVNQFLWREQDATKNSISMLGRAYFSHNQLNNKNGSQIQDMLMLQHGVNWNDLPAKFKRGSYVFKEIMEGPLSLREIDELPPKHNARTNPNLKVKRTRYLVDHTMPILSKISNKVEVFFKNDEPMPYPFEE